MRALSFIGLSALLAAANSGAPPPAGVGKDGQKLICKTQPTLAKRSGTRICHTRAEWEKIREEASRLIDDAKPRGLNTCMGMSINYC